MQVDRGLTASRYQFARSQVLVSQPLSSQVSLLLTAVTTGRATTGITMWLFTARSFILIIMAARLTGSSSPCEAL